MTEKYNICTDNMEVCLYKDNKHYISVIACETPEDIGNITQEFLNIKTELNHLNNENNELKQLIKQLLKTTPIPHNLAIQLKNHVRELL